MNLPFSHEAFLDVFGRYNTSLWPVVALMWLVTALAMWRWLRGGQLNARIVPALLAVHWFWCGVVYHWTFFREINGAAALFALMFVVEASAFAWLAARPRVDVSSLRSLRGLVGATLVIYGLAYPFIGLAAGLEYPRLPLFAVPCPTALVTAGVLVAGVGLPRLVNVIPILWCAVAGSSAVALGIRADLALLVAGALLLLDTIASSALGRRSPGPGMQTATHAVGDGRA